MFVGLRELRGKQLVMTAAARRSASACSLQNQKPNSWCDIFRIALSVDDAHLVSFGIRGVSFRSGNLAPRVGFTSVFGMFPLMQSLIRMRVPPRPPHFDPCQGLLGKGGPSQAMYFTVGAHGE